MSKRQRNNASKLREAGVTFCESGPTMKGTWCLVLPDGSSVEAEDPEKLIEAVNQATGRNYWDHDPVAENDE